MPSHSPSQSAIILAISATTYRGAKCPTLNTAEKQPKKGCRVGHGKTAQKQPENQPKHPKNSRKAVKTAVFRVFLLFLRLFFGCFTVTHSAPFFGLFFGCFQRRAFGTSVGGRGDCNIILPELRVVLPLVVLPPTKKIPQGNLPRINQKGSHGLLKRLFIMSMS